MHPTGQAQCGPPTTACVFGETHAAFRVGVPPFAFCSCLSSSRAMACFGAVRHMNRRMPCTHKHCANPHVAGLTAASVLNWVRWLTTRALCAATCRRAAALLGALNWRVLESGPPHLFGTKRNGTSCNESGLWGAILATLALSFGYGPQKPLMTSRRLQSGACTFDAAERFE